MSAIAVHGGDTVRGTGALLALDVPPGWVAASHGRDTVLWAPSTPGGFRTNVLVRVHEVPAGVGVDALIEAVDDELDARDVDGAAVERRGRTTPAIAGATGVAVLASFDAAAAGRRLLQLHVLVEASPAADVSDVTGHTRPVFHVVGTWPADEAAQWGEAIAALVTSAAVQRGRPAAPR